MSDGDLLARLNAVHDSMSNNPNYPSPPIDMPGFKAAIDAFTAAAAAAVNDFSYLSAWVAELADAPDLKTPFSAFSTTSETYQKLPKISFTPTTGADFSPISEAKAG